MLEVLAYLFEAFHSADGVPELPALARQLDAVGFESDDIQEALAWLSELSKLDTGVYADVPDTPRYLHPLESARLDEDAHAYWHYLEQGRVLTASEREMVLDRVLADSQSEIGAERLKLLVLMVVWRKRDQLSNLLIEEILFGRNGATLH
ncbi:Smg protein [Andreprevotia lacus DSM 23236]|jgi:Smg protein|uniref:Protein Smg homolog n=1 Tax=Andreprevotia lacus DSM 23236 TaxID=1121001 RepID=A0A1W1XYV5_9NEIS|nr:DUF494 domain-containing protein [Andreprevotia lacus]SMC28731.1 Smg protein [Andreprevotia lacus DSM 23236]